MESSGSARNESDARCSHSDDEVSGLGKRVCTVAINSTVNGRRIFTGYTMMRMLVGHFV